nr:hypothetical protein [Bacteroides intestinalis]
MKHLFYCLFLMLLCVGCKGEDDPMTEEENNSSSATTRAPGSLDLSLSGNVVSISWNEPFGEGIGIEVGVSTGSGMSLGSFSSSDDSGSDLFFLSSITSYSGPVTATVRGRSSNGYIVGQPITISLGILNDPTAPPKCNHGYSPSYPLLGISVGLNNNFYFSRGEFIKRGLLLYVLHVQSFDHYEYVPPYGYYPVYDVEDITNRVNLPALTSSTSDVVIINHPQLDRFWSRPDATFTLDIRIYDGECPKLAPGNHSSLPACTNYCVYQVTNLEPLSNISRSVRMSQVLDGEVHTPSY